MKNNVLRRRIISLIGLAAISSAAPSVTVSMQWTTGTDQPYMAGTISVGNPPVSLSTMFLMNYEETLVMSQECPNCIQPKYNASLSTSSSELSTPWIEQMTIPYSPTSDMAVLCRGISDIVCFG